ncbi:MAG: hypothetical protein KF819_14500 [Labilithrix sp.]|nr:hypothetical protein [Labilithrix sp.]
MASVGVAATSLVLASCSSDAARTAAAGAPDGSVRKDGGPVEALEAGPVDSGAPPPAPSCADYCGLVMESCTGEHAQYADAKECLAFCALMPEGTAGDTDRSSLACREVYAGTPALTDAVTYCPAAGPFGGGICGDRCTSFCQLAMAVCGPTPYGSYADCASACVTFAFKDAGEGPSGPESGDSLNCRLYHLRDAIRGGAGCAEIVADSGACR